MSVAQYISTVVSEAAHGVAETTHYPALKNLLNAAGDELTPKVRAIIHPASTGSGLPDGALWTATLLPKPGQQGLDLFDTKSKVPDRGGIEAKGLDQNLDTLVQTEQVRKYLLALKQVLITNFREFAVVQLRDGKPVIIERYTLAESKAIFLEMRAADARPHERPLQEFLRRALSAQTVLAAPGEVAFFLASHAREARDRLDLFENPLEMQGLKESLEKALGIKFAGEKGDAFFRAELIQTLFYGLFSAWVLWHEEQPTRTDAFDYRFISSYLRVPVIDRLYNAASSKRVLEQTKLIHPLRNAADTLNRVDRSLFFEAFQQGLAVQYFYEPFLAAFDPVLRKELGVWYTPPEIVKGMVAKCDRLLREELDEPEGLAGERVLLLDPCCGTGAFVVEALRVAAERWAERGEPYADKLRSAATKRMFGFELLTGPFVVAHLQVAFLLAKHKVMLQEDERAAIYLTNALTGWEPISAEKRILDPLALYAESERAHEVKRDERILVVVGNPPYSGYAGIAKMDEERALSDRYRPERSRGQGLNDLYVRFFAMADRRIHATGKGLVCLISNYSWLDGLSFVKMRETLMKGFDRIEIDNLHGDRIIGEYNPDGITSETVFAIRGQSEGIRPGVSVATLLHRGAAAESAKILYRDFHQAKAEARRAAFQASDEPYVELVPHSALGYPFHQRDVNTAYLSWPKLPEIFPTSFPGVKTSRDDLLVDIDLDKLQARMRAYFDPKVSDAEIERTTPGTMEPNARYDAQGIRRKLQTRGIRPEGFRRYAYRPFDVRWLYWEGETKLLDEKRSEYLAHVDGLCRFLVSQERPRRDWAGAQVTVPVSCLDLLDRGSSSFPLRLSSRSSDLQATLLGDSESASAERHNLSEDARSVLDRSRLSDQPETLFYHALAILHAPLYAAENAGALRQDWPRIPLAPTPAQEETAAWLLHGAELGRRVAALLDIETPADGIEIGNLSESLKAVGRFEWTGEQDYREATDDLDLAGGWGYRGQGGVVMPGNGRTVTLGYGTRDVVINDHARWTGIPEAVWNYHLGGYQVLKKWLSYRERKVLGRPLKLEEIRTFTAIARRIAALLALGPELDDHYKAATGWLG